MPESTAKAQKLPTVATLVAQGGNHLPVVTSLARYRGPQYTNIDALLAAPETPDAIVLQPQSAEQERAWLMTLRRDMRLALRPVFAPALGDRDVAALLDGSAVEPEQLYRSIGEIEARVATLPSKEYADDEARLLAYLYSRPGQIIAPTADWRSPQLYRYPLLEALDTTGLGSLDWVQSLRRRGLIEPVALLDRVRQCRACASSHLNYVDLCPTCGALDISETIFLHCHTCGNVAEQAEYLHGEGLCCRKCNARLRHIGVDYDRALETFCCSACKSRFMEPEVKARCLECSRAQPTTELAERRIESYRMSELGARMARTGHVGDLFALIDDMNCAHPAFFEQTLDWLLGLRLRHAELEFGVVCIRLVNVRELIETLTRGRAAQVIDGFARRLRELVRTTDLLMRSDDRHCWLLLPQTPAAGVHTLTSRISQLPAQTVAAGNAQLEIAIRGVVSSELDRGERSARHVMSTLVGGFD
jgi:GGDEF domain-containing protein